MSDRTLALVGPERPVSGSRGRAFRSHDRTLRRSATERWAGASGSVLMYANIGRTEETLCDQTLAVSGQA